LALYRCEETGAKIAGAMNRDWYGLAILREDVMAAMNALEGPTGGLQLRDDLFACHPGDDISRVI
jgi:hypothetical protein